MVYYAGIGSRKTPEDILKKMRVLGFVFAEAGYILRSGGADGADTAFEQGCRAADGKREIFLPWKDFNKNGSELFPPSPAAFDMAKQFHPAWDKLSTAGKKLHARNSHQVMGRDLTTPVSFVLCYAEGGGTEQAIRIATAAKIPVINMAKNWKRTEHGNSLVDIVAYVSDMCGVLMS